METGQNDEKDGFNDSELTALADEILNDQPPPNSITNEDNILELEIFKSNGSDCFGNGTIEIYKCDHIHRLSLAMKHCHSLNLQTNHTNHSQFAAFCETYTQALNDYNHFMTVHSHQIEEVNRQMENDKQFGKCAMKQCASFKRYYARNRREKSDDKKQNKLTDPKLLFYAELFDTLHHFIFHLFDCGMRTKTDADDTKMHCDDDVNNSDQYGGYVDQMIAKKQEIIQSKRMMIVHDDERVNDANKSKFNISVDEKDDETLGMDELFEYLEQKDIAPALKREVYDFLCDEEYDTDALYDDIDVHYGQNTSNIADNASHDWFGELLKEFVILSKIGSASFSAGITWFYWSWYKDRDEIPSPLGAMTANDYGGYPIKELYVAPKYGDYKEETLQHMDIKVYNEFIITKKNEYMVSQTVKAMKANHYSDVGLLHYETSAGTQITENHIICLILYCDFTDYCADFSSTFRKTSKFETTSQIRRRNQAFYWQSRYLREAIEIFGQNGMYNDKYGPFFSGVNCILHLPEFCLRLSSPTSTSKQITVAMRFAKSDGMVIQFNNTGSMVATALPFFDVSWLSRYSDEDERVFIGGCLMIRVESIINMDTHQNFEDLFHAMFIFDAMVSGVSWKTEDECDIQINKMDKKIMKRLLSTEKTDLASFDPYIVSTFKAYAARKGSITIMMWALEMFFKAKDMYHLVIPSDLVDVEDISNVNDYHNSSGCNLVSPNLFKIFQNVKYVNIETASYLIKQHVGGYPFNVLDFLEVISLSSTWIKIRVSCVKDKTDDKTWISNVSSSKLESEIKDKYNEKELNIQFASTTEANGNGVYEDYWLITRMSTIAQ